MQGVDVWDGFHMHAHEDPLEASKTAMKREER